MWVFAVDAAVLILGVALLGLLAWRRVIRPGASLGRGFGEVAARAGDALSALEQSARRDDGTSTRGPATKVGT